MDALEGEIRRDLQEVSATVMDAQELLRLRSSVMVSALAIAGITGRLTCHAAGAWT